MRCSLFWLVPAVYTSLTVAGMVTPARAQDVCPRGTVGGPVPEPEDLRSKDGALRVELSYHKAIGADGLARYCYIDSYGRQSPTLRVKPGDQVTIILRNEIPASDEHRHSMAGHPDPAVACGNGAMTAAATNLHFHGLTIPPVCNQDDALGTFIQPASDPFE